VPDAFGHQRVIFILLLFLAVFFVPRDILAKKASTIDELAGMYDISLCADCHEDKYEEWKTSEMGNSVIDPRVLRGWRAFIRLELDQEPTMSRKDLTICLNCHVPQIKDATEELVVHIADLVITAVEDKDGGKREAAKNELSKLNLNCLGCHNLRAKGLDGKTEAGTIYVPRNADNPAHEEAGFRTVKSELLQKSDFCAQCHHCPPSVPWEQCPTLYTSYIEDFIQKGGKATCQDCHMKEISEQAQKHEDKSPHWSHKFYGPRNREFLNSSVTINARVRQSKYLDIYAGSFKPAVVVEIALQSHAGHVMPHG